MQTSILSFIFGRGKSRQTSFSCGQWAKLLMKRGHDLPYYASKETNHTSLSTPLTSLVNEAGYMAV